MPLIVHGPGRVPAGSTNDWLINNTDFAPTLLSLAGRPIPAHYQGTAFLGTAAAEGYPNPFCRCGNCQRARALGGLSLRKRSAALINHDLLIDLGPDLIAASTMHGCSLAGARYCLQTHAHADHLDPSHFLSRSPEYGVPVTGAVPDPAAVASAIAALPDTVHATVLARLDALDPTPRRVVQLGAVLGRTFEPRAIPAMDSGLDPDALAVAIDDLLDRDLVRSAALGAVTFRHILIREVAYGTLPRVERARLHGAAGRWLIGVTESSGRADQTQPSSRQTITSTR